jgi:branched-chain amino acid transport system ATP-binding protein
MMLDVQGLRTGYGRIPILNGVSFSVNEGDFIGILGHNGMGKTTLLKALMGFLPATGGRVLFGHEDVTALEPYRRARLGLGYVPQGREIFPGLTVLDNLRMGCSKQAGGVEQDIITGVLQLFPRLRALLDRAGGALSGGEQQLLAIARCLCGNPRLVLLDEPTEGIQPSIIDEIVETLQRLRARSGLTMILVEQNLEFIAALSQRILIIQKGAITREVQPGDLADASLVGEFVGIAT